MTVGVDVGVEVSVGVNVGVDVGGDVGVDVRVAVTVGVRVFVGVGVFVLSHADAVVAIAISPTAIAIRYFMRTSLLIPRRIEGDNSEGTIHTLLSVKRHAPAVLRSRHCCGKALGSVVCTRLGRRRRLAHATHRRARLWPLA